LAERFPSLDSLPRNVLAALLARTAEGWHVLLRSDLPVEEAAADAFLLGRAGVFAVVVADRPPAEPVMRSVLRHAEERFASIRGSQGRLLARTAITVVVVGGANGARSPRDAGLYWSLPVSQLDRMFRRESNQLNRRQLAELAEAVVPRLPEYSSLAVHLPERQAESSGLMAEQELTDVQLTAALERPFDTWMTFLHPQQNAVASRDYTGPARISGPAGTGKTVVALHRLRHIGRHSVGPLLFTTFVRNLPAVNEAAFLQLAPELEGRAEFVNLHAWARGLLARRGVELNVNHGQIENAFGQAWKQHRDQLSLLEPSVEYWKTELNRVIKGRDIRTLGEYQEIDRRGRLLRLSARQREQPWQLFETYRDNLVAKGIHDYNDMLSAALTELVREPLEEPYAAIVADEVQDIPLIGLRLLREIAGDGPNRLLLVGDGQQQVYAGGWRLSDAGIPIQGRGEILRVNYRNRSGILDFAGRIEATNSVDDLDGAAGVALRDVESVNGGGVAQTWTGNRAELPAALVAAVRGLPVKRGQIALITFGARHVDECRRILESAGISCHNLEHHAGEPDDRVKIGTIHRAKGLDFQAVLVVQFPQEEHSNGAAQRETAELRSRQRLVAATRARDFLWWGEVAAADAASAGGVRPPTPAPSESR
jgi:hypothetical protein